MEVANDNGSTWRMATSAATQLEKVLARRVGEDDEVQLTRLLASVYHGQGVYLKASDRSREALFYFSKERELLEPLVDEPPKVTSHALGAAPSRQSERAWPQDQRALSTCLIDSAEAVENTSSGGQRTLRRACALYEEGLALQLPGERTVNTAVRARFEECKRRVDGGWVPTQPSTTYKKRCRPSGLRLKRKMEVEVEAGDAEAPTTKDVVVPAASPCTSRVKPPESPQTPAQSLLDKVKAIRRQLNLPPEGDLPLLTGLAEAENSFFGVGTPTAGKRTAITRADDLLAQIGV